MAGGNLGGLWVSLGIKETVSDGLKKVLVSLDKTDEKSATVGKEIKSFVKELNNASVSDSLLKSIGRIGELLSSSASGAESLGRVLKGLDIKELSLLGGKVNLSNLNEAHALITKIMAAMASGKMQNGSLDKFFDLGNAQAYLTYIMTIDKNLKALKENSKGITDSAMRNEAKTYIDGLSNLRKKFLESFNNNSWRGNNDLIAQLDGMKGSLIQFYDKLNASKGTPMLFDSLSKDAEKATESLRNTEAQAKKTAEAVSSIGSVKNPPKMREAKQEDSFNKEVDKIVGDSKSRREAQNELGAVKDAADQTKASVVKLKYELNEVLNAFRGAASKNLGVGDAGEKGRQLVDILNQINRKKAELSTMNGGDKLAAEMGSMVNNAMTYIRLLQRIDIAQRNIADKKSANPNIDASKFKEATAVITNFREKLTQLESSTFVTGVDSANVLGNYAKAWQVALGQVDEIIGKFQKRNPLSDLDSNFSKIDSKIDSFREKLAKLRDLMSEGTSKGFNTSMLTDRITGMSGIVAQMEKALANDGKILSNADRMKQLFNDMSVELSKTATAFQTYGREKGKVIAQEREHNKELSKLEQYEGRLRSISETISKVDRKIREFGESRDKGINLGASTSGIDDAISKLSEFRNRLNSVDANNKKGVLDLISDYRILINEIGNAKSKLDSLNRTLEALDNKNAAKATREANAAEKQRQTELENSLRRIQSMEKALANLQEKRFTSKMLGLDTSEAEAKINTLKEHIRQLYEIAAKLDSKDMSAVGKLGNLGNGRETQAANDLARSYDKANKEAQRGVELERKRQQEVSATAAKARNDLASAFAGVNAEAKKMQSIVGDIKSLFLQGGIVFGAQQFFNSIVQTGGEIVQQHVALRSILGDVQKADELFNQTQQLALQSPFKFGELNRDVKQLAAFGVEANDLYDTTKRLADIASGLGVSFERLGLAYGQVKARSWLDGKELRQFAYAGLPLLQRITEMYNATGKNGRSDYTQADVKKMISNRGVSFEDVQKVLWDMTNEGGQFYNMQFVLSETLLGKWNKLIDAWEIMLGKFAEGRSVIGGTFKYAISGATDLVLALDKLSPLLLSLGGTYVAKKGIGALYGKVSSKSGIGGMLSSQKEVADARLREYAIQQQQLVIEKQITQEKATQKVAAMGYALTSKEEQVNAMQRLALEGRLSIMQMQKAYREGLITPELLSQLEVMGMISAKQKEIIANATIGNRVRAAGMTMMNGVGKLFTWSNAAFVGISVAIGAVMKYFQKAEEVEQRSKDIATSAQQHINSLEEALSATKNITKDTASSEVEKVNEQLQEVLEQSGLFTETIKEQISQASTLTEKYQILKGAVSDAKEASSVQGKFSDTISKAIDSSGGFLNDDITENVKDVMESYNKMQTLLAGLDDATKERMSSIANQFLKPEQASLSLEEKIDLLADMSEDDFDKFVRAASNGSNDIAHSLYLIRDRANITKDHFDEIAKDDVPKILEVIRVALGKNEKEFRSWAQHNVKSFDSMFMKIIELCNANVPTIVTKLRKIFYESVGLEPPKEPSKSGNKPKPYDSGLKAGGAGENARKKLQKSGKLNKSNYKAYDAELRIHDSESSEEFGESLRKQYKEIRNENNARKKAGRKVSAESLARQKKIEEIAAVSGVSLDVGKNKVTEDFGKDRNRNNRQEDEDLKRLRKRIELYKKFYTELEKYRKLYGRSGALSMLNSEEEFKPVFKNFGLSDPGTYGTSIRELLSKVPLTTNDRKDYHDLEIGNIHAKNRSEEKDRIKTENDQLTKRLDIISEQYDTYEKLYELTGNSDASSQIAFGHVQSGTFKDYLSEQMKRAVQDHNNLFGSSFTPEEVFGMDENDFKQYFGENSKNISVLYDAMRKEINKLKKETIDLMVNLIEKNATIEQQIDDENRRYERQLELVKKIEDPSMRKRAKEGADKTHNENNAKLQFELFKESSDWVTIFDDLNRVSSSTIDSMVGKIDEFSKTAGLSVEVVKQLRDALGKLKDEQIDRNPLPYIFGSVSQGNAIGNFINSRFKKGMDISTTTYVGEKDAKKMGIKSGNYTKAQLEDQKQGKYVDSNTAMDKTAKKMQALANVLDPVVNLFKALGQEDSLLGKVVGGASNAFSSAANVAGGLSALGLENLGPYGAAAAAGLSVASSLISAFGADYSSYNKAKEQYDNLSSIWDSLISKKTEYMNIHWGTEANEASKEAQEMLEAEIEQTKIIARQRLSSGASAGSHAIRQRMWEGSYKYNGQNWRDVAPEISRKYGVQFNGMDDMLNMNSETLSKIKHDYVGLWANLDGDFRDYLEKLIEYGDKADEMIDNLTEKLTGNKFSSLVESWGDAMAQMSNSSDNLVDNFEENLKKTILNSMIENVYGKKIKALLEKTQKYAENGDKIKDENGNVVSEYTGSEYADVKQSTDDLAKQVEATRDFLKKTYGWSDNSSSSSTNSIKGITEEQASLGLSYLNGIRLDCSVIRAEQAKLLPEMSEIAKSQLTQLGMITQNTLRNAEAAERIEAIFTSYNDNFNKVLAGTKKLNVK